MRRAGFTFLEVMVSLAILAMALTALSGITANSFDSSNYSKFLTITTLLARSKMIDVEEELRKDGFGDDEKEFDGDFSEEGFPGIKWQAVCRPIEVDISQLVYGFLGADVDAEDLSGNIQETVAAMSGVDSTELAGENVGGSELNQLLGGGQLEPILKGVGETLKNSIREITLEITWKEGEKYEESIKFVQYVTTEGRLSLPQTGLPGLPATPPRSDNPEAPGQRNANTLQPTIGGQPATPFSPASLRNQSAAGKGGKP